MSEPGESAKNVPGNSSKQPEKFTRRDFLKLSGLTLGSLAFRPKAFENQSRKSSEKRPQKQEIKKEYEVENIQIGNLSLTAIVTEHNEKTWESQGQEILKELKSFPLVIPEYFPPEYKNNDKNSFMEFGVNYYDKENKLFDHVSDFCLKNSKEIRVLDAAYNEAIVAFRALINVPEATAYSVFGVPLAIAATERRKSKKETEVKSDKVSSVFHNTARAVMVGGALTGSASRMTIDSNTYEQTLRRVFVAQALIQLGNSLKPGSHAAIIYPPAHWYGRTRNHGKIQEAKTGIREYLLNESMRKHDLKLYDKYRNRPTFAPLFETRNYSSENGYWKKLPGFTIEV